jgi:alcohol-forming fatty acyl-CoA reductase
MCGRLTRGRGHHVTREAAFFDVDGTLCDTTIVHYYRYFMLRRLSPLAGKLWYSMFLMKCVYYLLLDRLDRQRLNIVFYRNYAGLPTAEIKAQAADCHQYVVRPRRFSQAPDCIEEHRRAGRAIVLVTGSLDFIIQPLAAEIRADAVIAARLVESDGFFTGELVGPPIGGQEKARRMRDFAAERGIDLSCSHAYGDSMADLPMLETVGFPHAVNPDRGLSATARRRGWPTHHWTIAGPTTGNRP